MERKVIVVCSIVGFLGLLSAVTGFAAEAKRVKVNHPSLFVYIYCNPECRCTANK